MHSKTILQSSFSVIPIYAIKIYKIYTAEFMILKDISLHAKNCEEKEQDVFYKTCMSMCPCKRECICMWQSFNVV